MQAHALQLFMVRRSQNFGLALLLAAALCLPAHDLAAQSTPPNPSAPATPAQQQKAHPHRKKALPDPPAPQAPEPPPTLEQSPPTPPQVSYNNGQLTIVAQNATLSQVLRAVQSQTGTAIEMPSGASSERVVGQLGPGQPRDVLSSLLNGTKFNYIILGVTDNPGAVQKVILTTPKTASTVNTAQNNAAPPDEPQDEESYNEPEPQPQAPPPPVPPQMRHRPVMPGRTPESFNPQQPQPAPDNSGDNSQLNGTKTPEQLLQELQQMQQQQQQMQDQLNPANRQPPQ
jgi:hypothetical protein